MGPQVRSAVVSLAPDTMAAPIAAMLLSTSKHQLGYYPHRNESTLWLQIQDDCQMPQHYVLSARNAGLFSNLNGVINRLHYTVGGDDACEVDWRADRLYSRDRLVPQSQFPYGTVDDGNVWLKFFEPLPCHPDPHVTYTRREIWELDHHGWFLGSYRAWGKRACRLYTAENAEWRSLFHEVYRRHIQPVARITERVDRFRSKYLENRPSVGVHIRNGRHSVEQVGGEVYDVSHFAEAIRDTYGSQNPTIFLATDKDVVVRDMQDEFGDAVVYQQDVIRSAIDDEEQIHWNRPGNYQLGDDVLSDALLLASCQRMIHTTSNVATAVALINPHVDMHYIGAFERAHVVMLSHANRLLYGGRSLRRWLMGSKG